MVIKSDKRDIISYCEDTSNLSGCADKLYIPETVDELIEVVTQCASSKTPLTAVSGHTGTTGGCIALSGAAVSMEKFNALPVIDAQKMTAHVGAGVTLAQLASEANKNGLRFSAASTEELSFVCGAVSTCASGVRGFGKGSIRKYVLELKILLTSGEIITIERGKIFANKRHFDFTSDGRRFGFDLPEYIMPKVKHQAGYYACDNMDLIDLFIGSEGTLGIILEAVLKLEKTAADVLDGLIFFDSEAKALSFAAAVRELKQKKSLDPLSLEYFDSRALEFLKPKNSFIPFGTQAAVYFEHEAGSDNELSLLQEEFFALCVWHQAMLDESIFATNANERKRIFEFRHSLPQAINEFLRKYKQQKVASDIAVPEVKFAQMYDYYIFIAQSSGLPYVNFGHIGECHLHFNFLPRNDAESKKAKELIFDLCRKGISFGGTVSAEHGIGKIKKPYLKLLYKQSDIDAMIGVKKYFDPACILGRDNIFEKELL